MRERTTFLLLTLLLSALLQFYSNISNFNIIYALYLLYKLFLLQHDPLLFSWLGSARLTAVVGGTRERSKRDEKLMNYDRDEWVLDGLVSVLNSGWVCCFGFGFGNAR